MYYLQYVQGVREFRPGNVAIRKKFRRFRFESVVNFDAILCLFHIKIATVVEQYQHLICKFSLIIKKIKYAHES